MKRVFILSFYLSTLAVICLFWSKPYLAFALLSVLVVLRLMIFKKKNNWLVFLLTGILGAISEIIAVNFGAWVYAKPGLINIPIWLPLVWGMAGLCFRDIYSFVLKIKN